MSTKRKKKRQLRPWVKITLSIIVILLVVFGLKSCFFDQEKRQAKADPDQEVMTTAKSKIIIDAGHGGMDGGAISTIQKTEKEFALEYALGIGEEIQKLDPNIEVLYTRVNDETPWVDPYTSLNYEYDDLIGRANLVNEKDPYYLLSVHFNSREDANESGFEAYVRGDDAASDQIYQNIAKNLKEIGYSKDRGVFSTETYPLHMVDMTTPSAMLIELGFMTNEQEVKTLNSPQMRAKICKAIAKGYVEYIKDHDNPDTNPQKEKLKKRAEEDAKKQEEAQKAAEQAAQQAAQANPQPVQ
ncbi:N-acetylmuramoyl-L-alanine amidase [Dubosiella newyorkensis]|uniref:N-acetylmuramoyl-L-alanine amidase n=1 Tax=Dubosiella newyorkensis TaxID=1862672 RepID=UPI00258AB132|nr:N-acetylmuramoyl-L-alanine amidase [Dubosiella newyorkensis]